MGLAPPWAACRGCRQQAPPLWVRRRHHRSVAGGRARALPRAAPSVVYCVVRAVRGGSGWSPAVVRLGSAPQRAAPRRAFPARHRATRLRRAEQFSVGAQAREQCTSGSGKMSVSVNCSRWPAVLGDCLRPEKGTRRHARRQAGGRSSGASGLGRASAAGSRRRPHPRVRARSLPTAASRARSTAAPPRRRRGPPARAAPARAERLQRRHRLNGSAIAAARPRRSRLLPPPGVAPH